jgi:hypothetical protein
MRVRIPRFSTMARTRFIPVDELGWRVQDAIDELVHARRPERVARRLPGFNPRRDPTYEGFFARACEAYWFLARDGRTRQLGDPRLEPRYVKHSDARGDSHYWMRGDAGIMDLNFGPDEAPTSRYCRYRAGLLPNGENDGGIAPSGAGASA